VTKKGNGDKAKTRQWLWGSRGTKREKRCGPKPNKGSGSTKEPREQGAATVFIPGNRLLTKESRESVIEDEGKRNHQVLPQEQHPCVGGKGNTRKPRGDEMNFFRNPIGPKLSRARRTHRKGESQVQPGFMAKQENDRRGMGQWGHPNGLKKKRYEPYSQYEDRGGGLRPRRKGEQHLLNKKKPEHN